MKYPIYSLDGNVIYWWDGWCIFELWRSICEVEHEKQKALTDMTTLPVPYGVQTLVDHLAVHNDTIDVLSCDAKGVVLYLPKRNNPHGLDGLRQRVKGVHSHVEFRQFEGFRWYN